ncbi:MAG: acyl carrier protein [bacterium]
MNQNEILEKIKDVCVEILNIDTSIIKPESRFSEDLGADSLQSLELVASFDETFDIEMDEDGALAVKTVGDAVSFISKYVNA